MNDQYICPRESDERISAPSTAYRICANRVCARLSDHLGTTISESDRFDQMGLDSLDEVEMLMMAEDDFGVTIEDGEAFSLETVADAVRLLESKVGGTLGEWVKETSPRTPQEDLIHAVGEYLPILDRLEQSGEWDQFAAGTGIATVNRLRTTMERAQKG